MGISSAPEYMSKAGGDNTGKTTTWEERGKATANSSHIRVPLRGMELRRKRGKKLTVSELDVMLALVKSEC
jgi:hypothetical protein